MRVSYNDRVKKLLPDKTVKGNYPYPAIESDYTYLPGRSAAILLNFDKVVMYKPD